MARKSRNTERSRVGDKKSTPFCEEPQNAAMALERELNKTMAAGGG